ncbi:MAG: glycosyltransferase family 4 protein [Patescibacteria group bacterium]|nr:glycosyltransferase family 4 protein [Patescibacteria group bacterium]
MIGQKGIPAQYGGIERHVEELSKGLADFGHQVFVYTRPHYTDKNLTNYQKINLISLPSIHTKHLDAIVHTFLASVHSLFQNYDIIHYHGVGPSLLAWIPRIFKPKAKVVATFHCVDRRHQKWGKFAQLALRMGEIAASIFPHETISVSRTLQNYIKDNYKQDSVYIPNGVNIQTEKLADEKQTEILKEFNLTSQKYIVMISRLVRHKGAHYLIQAWQQLKDRKDMKLVIVGGSAFTDDYVQEIQNLASQEKDIILTGNQTGDKLETLFRNAYLFILPSESEGLPIVILEAMNYEVPVLASDIPENLELVDIGGFSFKCSQVDDLKNKLERLLEQPEIIKVKAKTAKELINKNYNWQNIVQQIQDLYQNLIDKTYKVKQTCSLQTIK